jgi:SAM-dependent methyltransferase
LSRKTTISLIEKENVKKLVSPFIASAKVLELACGSGFYTHDLIDWGASSVVALDISETMVHQAKSMSSHKKRDGVKFLVADCSVPQAYPGGPFDVVFAAWLLDNAPDREVMLQMFHNVSLNLKPGGHFVTVTAPPAPDPRSAVAAKNTVTPNGAGGVNYEILSEGSDGLCIRVHGPTAGGDVSFCCYYLRQDVYESCAREAGLTGKLRWEVTAVPDRFIRRAASEACRRELEGYKRAPQYGILLVSKPT